MLHSGAWSYFMINNISDNHAHDDSLSNFEVTTHTAGMWKYNPIPEKPEPYSEYLSSYENNDYAEIIAARVRGKKHKHEGTNCDDWYEFKIIDDAIIVAVADGAGSKLLSRIGAKESCKSAVSYLENEFKKLFIDNSNIIKNLSKDFDDKDFIAQCTKLASVMQGSVNAAFDGIDSAFKSRRLSDELIESIGKVPDIKDFSSTLLVAVIIPVNVNNCREHFVISVQIGDGMIASVNRDADFADALRILGNADGGSFAGETEFITSESTRLPESLMSRTKIGRRKISSLMLMTDGVADDYYPNTPEILRLYLDLQLNNIIGEYGFNSDDSAHEFIDKIPKPVSYPWVNDSDICYAIQYAKNIITNTALDLEKLWSRHDILNTASLKYFNADSYCKDKAEMLSVWLDNYVERGSFDDRTLVIINVK